MLNSALATSFFHCLPHTRILLAFKDSPDGSTVPTNTSVFLFSFLFLKIITHKKTYSFNSFTRLGIDLLKITADVFLLFAFCGLCLSKVFNTPAFLHRIYFHNNQSSGDIARALPVCKTIFGFCLKIDSLWIKIFSTLAENARKKANSLKPFKWCKKFSQKSLCDSSSFHSFKWLQPECCNFDQAAQQSDDQFSHAFYESFHCNCVHASRERLVVEISES